MQGTGAVELSELRAFVAVAETSSFSAAGRLLDRDPTVVSRRLQALEGRLGVRLAERTTRKVSLTEAGRAYLSRLRPLLQELDAAEREVGVFADGEPRGHLRLAIPGGFGRLRLGPIIVDFLASHRRVSINATVTNHFVDLIGEGFDIAVRLGDLPDSRLVVRKVAERRRLVCASPAYLSQNEAIREPKDLARHSCLCFTNHADPYHWLFAKPDGGVTGVAVSGPLASEEVDLLVSGAVAGLGVLHVTDWYVANELASGKLVEVLGHYPIVDKGAVYVVTPAAGGMPSKTRAFSDWLAKGLSAKQH
jgi:DNA-binding transcriptional LysR family regulator